MKNVCDSLTAVADSLSVNLNPMNVNKNLFTYIYILNFVKFSDNADNVDATRTWDDIWSEVDVRRSLLLYPNADMLKGGLIQASIT